MASIARSQLWMIGAAHVAVGSLAIAPAVAAADPAGPPRIPADGAADAGAGAVRCPSPANGEIVVCGARRLPGPPPYGPSTGSEPDIPGHPMHFRLGNASVDGHAFTNARGTIADGLTITLPF